MNLIEHELAWRLSNNGLRSTQLHVGAALYAVSLLQVFNSKTTPLVAEIHVLGSAMQSIANGSSQAYSSHPVTAANSHSNAPLAGMTTSAAPLACSAACGTNMCGNSAANAEPANGYYTGLVNMRSEDSHQTAKVAGVASAWCSTDSAHMPLDSKQLASAVTAHAGVDYHHPTAATTAYNSEQQQLVTAGAAAGCYCSHSLLQYVDAGQQQPPGAGTASAADEQPMVDAAVTSIANWSLRSSDGMPDFDHVLDFSENGTSCTKPWQQFGLPIGGLTPEDSEQLDWLSEQLMNKVWSLREVHR